MPFPCMEYAGLVFVLLLFSLNCMLEPTAKKLSLESPVLLSCTSSKKQGIGVELDAEKTGYCLHVTDTADMELGDPFRLNCRIQLLAMSRQKMRWRGRNAHLSAFGNICGFCKQTKTPFNSCFFSTFVLLRKLKSCQLSSVKPLGPWI